MNYLIDTYVNPPMPWLNERYLQACANYNIFWYDGSHPFAKRFKYKVYGVSPEGILIPQEFSKEILAIGSC